MSDMMQTGFDYGALPVELAVKSRAAAERIKLRLKRTVEDIIEIGRELTAIKAELPHGQFLPWIAAEFEMSERTARDFMQVHERFGGKSAIIADFKPTILYALSAPSTPESVIEKAVEQAEAGDKVTVADVKQWKDAAQSASQRAEEFRQESNARRKKIRELEQQVDLLKTEKPEPEVRIEAPSDYEATKERAEKLASDLKRLKEQQADLVQKQVADKLKEREKELAEIDQRIKGSEEILAGLQKHIDRYSQQQRELNVHLDTIEKARVSLAVLAANLEGFESVIDSDHELRLWRALSQMMRNGANAIDFFVGDSKPALTVIK